MTHPMIQHPMRFNMEILWVLHWYDAMDAALEILYEKRCFELVDKSEAEGRQIVDSTWVFKCKPHPDGTLLKCKARLCI